MNKPFDFKSIPNPYDTDMQRRRFGRTEIEMPVLSTGGMRYQDGWTDKPLSEVNQEVQSNLEACIHRSLELGINHIETARGYGVSERQLGAVLPKCNRNHLIVQTKVAPTDDPKEFESHVRESLERLQLSHVDLLGIHGVNDESVFEQTVRPGGCLEMARKLQEEGLVRHVGCSTHGDRDLLLEIVNHDKDGGFDYINLHWFFIMQRNWPAIEQATKRDVGVFIISPSDKGGMLYKPSEVLMDCCGPLHPMEFNDLFCLQDSRVHTISIGAAKPSDFDLHVSAAKQLPKAKELTSPIAQKLTAVMKQKTGHGSPEWLTDALPPWNQCPGNLNIRVMHWLHQLAIGWGLEEYTKMRLNLLGNGGHWFPGVKADKIENMSDDQLKTALTQCENPDQVVAELRHVAKTYGGEDVKRLSES